MNRQERFLQQMLEMRRGESGDLTPLEWAGLLASRVGSFAQAADLIRRVDLYDPQSEPFPEWDAEEMCEALVNLAAGCLAAYEALGA